MTWTPERRQQQAERMTETRRRLTTGELKAKFKGTPSPIPLEDRKLIRALGDERDALKVQLSREQAEWEARRAYLKSRLSALSNEAIAEKFDLRENQVRQVLNGVAGQSL